MKKIDVVQRIVGNKLQKATKPSSHVFAPSNIALCKYWGKRNIELNLPITSSLSISLGDKGATTQVAEIDAINDQIFLNQKCVPLESAFGFRLTRFLDLFRPSGVHYRVDSTINIPVAAGLASSACGFAATVLALNELYTLDLDPKSLSILARLGSGSASRSLWHGFVKWQAGDSEDGMDSFATPLPIIHWPQLRVGLILLSDQQKPLSSTEAMLRTVKTSKLYSAWPAQVEEDMQALQAALDQKNFEQLGQIAETNALAMHATMTSAKPAIFYSLPETLLAMQKVWQLRAQGISVYFTQDAGPNLKLLFLDGVQDIIYHAFPNMEICKPF